MSEKVTVQATDEKLPLQCSKCGEPIQSDLGCACHRLQKALDAESQRLEANANTLFWRFQWANLRKETPRDAFGDQLNALRSELEKLLRDSSDVYGKLGRANRKIVGFYFVHWVRQKTKQDLSKVLDEHFTSWVHSTLHQYDRDGGEWLAPRWLREFLPGGDEEDEPESILDQQESLKLLHNIRLAWIDDLCEAAIDTHLDEIEYETHIADACAPQIPHGSAGEATILAQDFPHSEDYESIFFDGMAHTLTPNQAIIVRTLHEAYLMGFPEVANARLLEAIGSKSSRVRDSFKNSSLWKTLVIKGSRKGFFRLSLPESRR